MNKNEQYIRKQWDTIKYNNIHIMCTPEGEERKRQKKIFEE